MADDDRKAHALKGRLQHWCVLETSIRADQVEALQTLSKAIGLLEAELIRHGVDLALEKAKADG